MSKLWKSLALVTGTVVLVALGVLGWLVARKPGQRPPSSEVVERTSERLKRGEYLVKHVAVCLGCHSEFHADRFAMPYKPGSEGRGGFPFDELAGVPGVVCAQNLTPDPDTGKGRWSDGELMRAIREGVSRDGHALFPMMPYPFLRSMSDEDTRAVVAYLRTLRPQRNAVPPTRLKFPVGLLIKSVPQPLAGPVAMPDPAADPLGYGRYLTTIAGCIDCHTPRDEHGAPRLTEALSGGWEIGTGNGRVVTANLTPDPGNWLGQASKQQFIGRFKSFASLTAETSPVMPPGRNTVMPWLDYAGMSEPDLGAIYDYLRSLPPVKKAIVSFPDAG